MHTQSIFITSSFVFIIFVNRSLNERHNDGRMIMKDEFAYKYSVTSAEPMKPIFNLCKLFLLSLSDEYQTQIVNLFKTNPIYIQYKGSEGPRIKTETSIFISNLLYKYQLPIWFYYFNCIIFQLIKLLQNIHILLIYILLDFSNH